MTEYEVEEKNENEEVATVRVDRRRINGRVRNYVLTDRTLVIPTPRYLLYSFPPRRPEEEDETRARAEGVPATDLNTEIQRAEDEERDRLEPMIASYMRSILMEMEQGQGQPLGEDEEEMNRLTDKVFTLLDEYRSKCILK